jgi:N-acetyl-gamma-glutamyl-phosphate reductase
VIGATGYVGGELIRLLAAHPAVELVGLTGRERRGDPIGTVHPHLATTDHVLHSELDGEVDAVFLALPHGTAAARVPELLKRGITVIDQGPDFRLRDAADYPRWYGFEHPHPELLARAVYGLPELHRAELVAAGAARAAGTPAIVGSPGCYPTATVLALAPLARAGLITDVVVDAKSGVSGAGRDVKAEMLYAEVNESVRAYGVFTHRHTAEMEQELGLLAAGTGAEAGVRGLDFLPHLIPMTRGILSACHVRPARPVAQAELDALYAEAYDGEPFVTVVGAPPATGHVLGSNHARVYVRSDERTGRILAIGVIDNLVKGAAGQGVQAFNLAFGLPETAGLEALPIAP